MNYERFNNELLRRLSGYPINILDRNSSPLVSGNIVKVYYNIFEKEKNEKQYVLGKIRYDFLRQKFIVRLDKNINNTKQRNLILSTDKNGNCAYSKAIENTGQIVKNNYIICKSLVEKDYKEFYKTIINLFYDDEIHLLEDEIQFIKNELNDVINVNINISMDVIDYNNEKNNIIVQNGIALSNDIEKLLDRYINLRCNNLNIDIQDNNKTLLYIKTPFLEEESYHENINK